MTTCEVCGVWEDVMDGAEYAGPPVCWDCAGTTRGDLVAERYYLVPRTSADVARLVTLDRLLTYDDLAAVS